MIEPMGKYMFRAEISNGLYVGSIPQPITASADQMNSLYAMVHLLTEFLYREDL